MFQYLVFLSFQATHCLLFSSWTDLPWLAKTTSLVTHWMRSLTKSLFCLGANVIFWKTHICPSHLGLQIIFFWINLPWSESYRVFYQIHRIQCLLHWGAQCKSKGVLMKSRKKDKIIPPLKSLSGEGKQFGAQSKWQPQAKKQAWEGPSEKK